MHIIISVGEPAGIGPDLVIQLAQRSFPAHLIAVADPDMLLARAKLLNLPLTFSDSPKQPGEIAIIPTKLAAPVTPKQLNPDNAHYVLEGIRLAAEACLSQEAQAMVTGPVHKGVINEAGIAFSGHTEYLAELSRSPHVVMLLSGQNLRVALATTHLPLKDVPSAITPELLSKTLLVLDRDLKQKFAMTKPRIAICGLNPHAGENGHIGREEIEVLMPCIRDLRAQGLNLSDPIAADSLFHPSIRAQYDVILAMYHDQGLAPFKAVEFGEGVNVTLGLPFVRTSVDHGTALNLAATGQARADSFIAATKLAIRLSGRVHAS